MTPPTLVRAVFPEPAPAFVGGAAAAVAAGALGAAAALSPGVCLALVAGVALAWLVWLRPVVAGVLVAVVTPLVAGIDRGRLIPGLRPNEALFLFLATVLLVRAVATAPTGHRWRPRLTAVETTLVAMAVANSVLVLGVMIARGQVVEPDDISYALVLWKYLGLYALVRYAVRDEHDIRLCLWAAMGSACVVGVIGVMQALDLGGVRGLLLGLYAPFGYTGALALPRGGSTLGLPAATADLLILNFVAATGLWWKDQRHGPALLGVAVICMGGTFAAAEFSSAFGLAVAVVCTAVVCGRFGVLRLAPIGLVAATAGLWPVIQHRLAGFQSVSGLPVSWTTRIANLENYFLPQLFSGTNPFLGVRPAARVVSEHQGTGFVWIESGYVWLLWGGGLPLLLAFLAFVLVATRTLRPWARALDSYTSVAALVGFVGVVLVAALMVFDPHITYRGSADWLFSVLAMAASGIAAQKRSGAAGQPDHGRPSAALVAGRKRGTTMRRPRSVGDRTILRTHAWIVVLATLLTCGAAVVVGLSRPTEHVATAKVELLQTPTRGAPLLPDMGTEREVATSGTVAEDAAARMTVSRDEASKGLSVSVVTDTDVLVFAYAASSPTEAVRGAEAFTRAYTAIRNEGQRTRVAAIITQPSLLADSSGRPWLFILAAGLAGGLVLGAACAWAWDRLSDKVRSSGELERAGPPVLATDLDVQGAAGPEYGYLSGQLMAMTDGRAGPVRILVTSPRGTGPARAVAVRLCAALSGHGRSVELVQADLPDRVQGNGIAPGRQSVIVQTSASLLDDSESWVVAERADITLLAVQLGRLRRADVDATVRAIDRVPGVTAGWVTCRDEPPSDSVPFSAAPGPRPPFMRTVEVREDEESQDGPA